MSATRTSRARVPMSRTAFEAKTNARRAGRAGVRARAKESTTTIAEIAKSTRPMKIVFVSAECSPWSKTGGLGDVVGSLPVELAKRGHKVMTVSPRYDQYAGAWDTSVHVEALGKSVGFFHEKKQGVDRIFVDHPDFLAKVWGKTGSKLYGEKSGHDFADNQERFAMFCHAALKAPMALTDLGYGEDVIFVANDWHSALVPVILNKVLKPAGMFAKAKCAMTIHNIAFQGRFFPQPMSKYGLPEDAADDFFFEDGYSKVYDENTPAKEQGKEDFDGKIYRKVNWLKAGFMNSDRNLTVSENYAKEIASSKAKGVELDHVIREFGMEGIVNGMDPAEWNPAKDKFIDVPYDKTTVVEGKAAAKQALQAEVGLPLDPTAPVFGYIGRLEEQKGCDIMFEAVPKLLKAVPNAQVVILGTGKKVMETALEKLDAAEPNCAGVVKFSAPLAHFINAGADFLMVPSRFEPCGLIQLHAMQYGTVPIVSSTGGLVDTVKEGVTGYHMGAMDADDLLPADVDAMVETCASAAADFSTPLYKKMSATCISQDLTWAEPAKKWEGVLEEMYFGTPETTKKAEVVVPIAKADALAAQT
ncbi:Glycosyl transferase, family 1 [Ostreococcus tauri]|uniref:Starch synthase, chloroplastic/amyloplastic n=1 Tax=Ostreococcus tauri TaxID=70448 RepID=A0A090M6X9_OSTTA|nr:Glycosyl transferase, family 1 [Ostreococcus tauri]CEF98412.1 Glycosyl transferase, family 1 [Ostreococcus tauri]|eukprot:XP_022839246.1 Glycosyl transferase, family 1 [Ostreococcus tauri]